VNFRASSSGGGTERRHDLGGHHDRVGRQLAQRLARVSTLTATASRPADCVVGIIEIQAPRRRNHAPIGAHVLRVGFITTCNVSSGPSAIAAHNVSRSADRVKNSRPDHTKVPSERASHAECAARHVKSIPKIRSVNHPFVDPRNHHGPTRRGLAPTIRKQKSTANQWLQVPNIDTSRPRPRETTIHPGLTWSSRRHDRPRSRTRNLNVAGGW
jgi:hypothetical protein